MIIEIALGIVLAVVILALLPYILALGVLALVVLVPLGILLLAWGYLSQRNWAEDDVAAIVILAGITVSVFSLVKVAELVERRTKKRVLEGEVISLVVFIPAAAYMLALVIQELWADSGGEYLPHYFVGFAAALMPIGLCVWRIRRRQQ